METNNANKTFTVLNHSLVKDESWAVHRAGCKDIQREVNRHGSWTYDVTGTILEVFARVINDETREMGYDASNVKVHACCAK